jgi:tetratricopeptide (TPR) repeat protein
MKRFLALAGVVLLAACGSANAAGPDQQYVEFYGLIQEADKLADAGQTRAAVTRYLEAQTGLKNLQTAFPDWNSKIVGFRLDYISSKLEPLTQKVASGAAGPAPVAVSPAQAMTNQLRQLQEDISRLSNQNALLEAKLREALTVQPAASDPRELAKAEDKIKQLQKERDLLAVTLEQSRATPPAATASEKEKQAIEELKRQLASQSAMAELLRKQNEDLIKQASAPAAPRVAVEGGSSAQILELKEALAMLQASNRMMQAEQVAMENRLLEWVRHYGAGTNTAAGREKDFEAQLALLKSEAAKALKERDDLLLKVNEVTRQLNERPAAAPAGASSEQLEKQLETLRAKVQIFEAKAVPYTADELALFKQPPPKETAGDTNKPVIAAASTPPGQKKRDELPAGARGLMAAAERAIDTGKYDEAEKRLAEILRMDEGNVYVLSRLAAAQLDQDKTTEAEGNLKKVLAADPEHPASLAMLGDLKFRQEKYDEAIDALSLAAKIRPDRPDTHYMLGRALIQKGNRATAEASLRKAVQLRPTWGEPHYQLAVLYATQQPGYPELAQYHYKKSIAGGVPRNLEFEKFLEKPPKQ